MEDWAWVNLAVNEYVLVHSWIGGGRCLWELILNDSEIRLVPTSHSVIKPSHVFRSVTLMVNLSMCRRSPCAFTACKFIHISTEVWQAGEVVGHLMNTSWALLFQIFEHWVLSISFGILQKLWFDNNVFVVACRKLWLDVLFILRHFQKVRSVHWIRCCARLIYIALVAHNNGVRQINRRLRLSVQTFGETWWLLTWVSGLWDGWPHTK